MIAISKKCGDPILSKAGRNEAPVKCLFPGNWADPTVCRLGDAYYLTSNNDGYIPSVMVFSSRDLKRWDPLGYACPEAANGPATDITAHDGKLFIYGGARKNPWVVFAEPPFEKWSERINMEPLAPAWPEGWDDAISVNLPLSDDFGGNALAQQWQSLGEFLPERYSFIDGGMAVEALDVDHPGAGVPVCVNPRHFSYEIETEVALEGDVTAGLILFYSSHAYLSFGLSHGGQLVKHVQRSLDEVSARPTQTTACSQKTTKLRLKNDRQDVSVYYSDEAGNWTRLEYSFDDVSGFQHNVFGGFRSVRPGIYVTGRGKARFSYFHYRGLQ